MIGGKGLVSMVVQSYFEERVHRHMVVVVDSPLEVVVAMRIDQVLPSLIVPTLMPILIVISSSCNIIVTRLIAKGVRVHSK